MISSNHEFKASFITAPDEYIVSLEKKEYSYLPDFKNSVWIWPSAAVRGHLTKSFDIDFDVTLASFEFIYDFRFDLYLNGYEFSAEKYGDIYRIAAENIADKLHTGSNIVAFRLYQSNNIMKFSAALFGGIRIFGEEKSITVNTDGSFNAWLVCNFYEETEPENWFLKDSARQKVVLHSSKIHPKYLRRSFIFEKSFTVNSPISSATLFATAEGIYDARLNGKDIDDARFLPGSAERVKEYQTFDITDKINTGKNLISFTLGNGWLNSQSWGWLFDNKPSLLAEIRIEYRSGITETIKTDESFIVYPSPCFENDLQFGERYDARLEVCGEPSDFTHAVQKSAYYNLVSQNYPPIRITKIDKATSVRELYHGVMLYDFGTNGAGRARINLKNTKSGEIIKIRYAEFIRSDGHPHIGPYQEVYFPCDNKKGGIAEYSARNMDVYICRGGDSETYLPKFTFTGFRYVYIEGYSGEYKIDTVERAVMHTDLNVVGDIDTDNPDIFTMWDVIKRTYRSNIFTGPLDCPTREKNFWNGDIQAFVTTASWYMDNKDFLISWSKNGRKLQYNVYGWEDEEYILPLALYKFHGDKNLIESKYRTVLDLIKKRESQIEDGDLFPAGKYSPYRDWKSTINVSGEFHASVYYTYMYKCASLMADILGINEDKERFAKKFEKLREEFNKKFYLDDEGRYSEGCQSADVLPLALGIVRDEDYCRTAKSLHESVVRENYHMTTGFMGSEYLLGILCDNGYEEDAIKIILGRSFPSLLNMIDTGATTTTENWDGSIEFGDVRDYDSTNHFALGVVGRWFFEYLGGIRILESGFKKIHLKPVPYKEVGRLRATHNSPLGLIEAEICYDKEADKFVYTYSVPEGVEAYVTVPGENMKRISCNQGKFEFRK